MTDTGTYTCRLINVQSTHTDRSTQPKCTCGPGSAQREGQEFASLKVL